ncbi:hypothetical protein [Pseudomonas izuensis]|uniref:hypothetical protein n=1 Tax=Pseudomonas izuensis TaxID=2684212 RepID=UPI001359B765|nr:hypothetical protein [Pseudomonas izuensis]
MPGAISNSMGNLRVSSDSGVSSSIGQTSGSLFEALDLAVTDSQRDNLVTVGVLGSPRAIKAGWEKFDRSISLQLKHCVEELGETDLKMREQIQHFVESGQQPDATSNDDFVIRLDELNESDTQQTPVSRMHSVIDAACWVLDKAKDHGGNVANVAARTGTIVTVTSLLRDAVAFLVAKMISEDEPPEAVREGLTIALTMIGPALILIGALRDECSATATLKSRLGRVLMSSIFMGSFIAAQLTGATSSMLTAAARVTVYTLSRDIINAFVPLNDNAGAPSNTAVAVSMAGYGAMQFALAELADRMPLHGAARHAAALDYSFFADLLHSVTNGFGAVADDYLLPLCKHWFPISRSVGIESQVNDPESLRKNVLEVTAGLRLANRHQIGNSFFSVTAARTTAFMAIIAVAFAADSLLADSELGEDTQSRVLRVIEAGMLMLIYFPFIFMCSQRTVETPVQLSENITP